MIDTLVFDAGNVLVKVENEFIIEDISNTLGISKKKVKSVWSTLIPKLGSGKITEDEFWNKFSKITRLQNRQIPKDLLVRQYRQRFTTNDEVFAIVDNLKSNQYKLGIISDTIPSHAELLREKLVFNPFSVVLLSYEVGFRRPNIKLFQLALKKLKSKPENTIFIDDNPNNTKALREYRLSGITFRNPDQLRSTLEKMNVNCQPPLEKKETNIGVHALLITDTEKMILQARSFQSYIANPGKISMFGGTIEKKESLANGLRRELNEELSLQFKDKDLVKLGVYKKTKELDGIDHISHVFILNNVNIKSLVLKEGLGYVVGAIDQITKNKKLTRITRLAIEDYSKKK
jgi:putative hydrolase of the HAD superfamily